MTTLWTVVIQSTEDWGEDGGSIKKIVNKLKLDTYAKKEQN